MKLTGRASVPALQTTVTHASMGANSAWLPATLNVTHDADIKIALIDPTTGERIGGGYAGEHFAATITLYFVAKSGSSQTLANAKAAMDPIDLPYVVTFAGSDDSDFDGDYLYEGGMVFRWDPQGYAQADLPVKKWIGSGAASASTLATVVS